MIESTRVYCCFLLLYIYIFSPCHSILFKYYRQIQVFHSQDDVIFDVHNSDRLVQQLEMVNNNNNINNDNNNDKHIVQYSRYNRDPENLPARVKGHSMGITASKSSDLYDWMIQ